MEYECCGMTVKKFSWDIIDSNAYLIETGQNGLLIDAIDSQPLYDAISELKDLTVILTHSHFDHICGLNAIREIVPGATVISTKKCSENIGNVYRNMSATANAYLSFYQNGAKRDINIEPFVCKPASSVFEGKMTFEWNGMNLLLKACYGHSDDGLMALLNDEYLFTGDTLLPIPTVTRFRGGSRRRFLNEDIPYLESLSGSVKTVFPGHGYVGAMETMLDVNRKG